MKKKILISGAFLVGLFLIYNGLGKSGILKVFNNTTTANEPNLKVGSYFITTNLITPKNGDFVSYQRYDELLGLHYRIHRLCGIAGDFVELKDGILFINGDNADAHMNLIHYYKISVSQIDLLFDYYSAHEFAYPERINDSVYRIHLDDDYASQNGFSNKRIVLEKNEPDQVMQHIYNQNWNKDNFGPLQIPEGKAFVLGDNRDNSEDSRYFGLINLKDIKGRLINY